MNILLGHEIVAHGFEYGPGKGSGAWEASVFQRCLDVKNWRSAPQSSDGKLCVDGESRDEHAAKLLAVTKVAESAVASLGMSPVAVRPLMIFAGHRVDAELGRIRLLGEHEVGPALLSERHRLRAESVRAIADHLDRVFPQYEGSFMAQAAAPSSQAAPKEELSDGLFDLDGLRDAALEEALRAPIEQWMTFLHPDQVALVRRNWAGPARISGPSPTTSRGCSPPSSPPCLPP